MVDLLYGVLVVEYHTDIAKVVFEIVMIASSSQAFSIGKRVVRVSVIVERHISSIYKQHLRSALFVDLVAAVVGCLYYAV